MMAMVLPVVELNNVAVALLECGAYLPALTLLETAIAVARNASQQPSPLSQPPHPPYDAAAMPAVVSPLQVQHLLAQARALIVTSKRAIIKSGIANTTNPTTITIEAISSDYNPNQTFDSLIRHGPEKSTVRFPVLIEVFDNDNDNACGTTSSSPVQHRASQSPSASEVEFHSSILLYNYAIVFDCLAAVNALHDPTLRSYLAERAYFIYQLASCQLYSQCLNRREDSTALFTIGRLLQFKAYLTYSLILSCRQLGMATQEHCSNLEDVMRLMTAREEVLRTTAHNYAAAA
jgi:hypothetical protein